MRTRDRLALSVVIVAAAVAAAWFLAIAPKRREAADLGAQVGQAQARRDAAAGGASADVIRATYRKDYATIARLGKAVPPRADVASLVFQLEAAARAAKVDFRSVTVEDPPKTAPAASSSSSGDGTAKAPATPAKAASDVAAQPFTFSFEGKFAGLRRLLAEINRFARVHHNGALAVRGRLLTIDSVVMTAGRRQLPWVKADITAKAYVADLPAALPAARSGTQVTAP
ncbi:MAG TPA: hypothetical protein VGO81_15110 [Solirubrobacteraceae bacterium]|nr:hypothetical protein [Solirubrobacteraceae bacterium]